jgi:hypothetical protein
MSKRKPKNEIIVPSETTVPRRRTAKKEEDVPPTDETPKRVFIRAAIEGIVYLIDSKDGRVYTYNPKSPIYIGDLERVETEVYEFSTSKKSPTETLRVRFRPDWKEIMENENQRS